MRRPRSFIGPGGMAGMVGLWGASSLIRNVQRGTVTYFATSTTATITAVDTANTVVTILGVKSGTAGEFGDKYFTRVALTNSTTLTFVTNTASAFNRVVSYEVIEYHPGVIKSRQAGTFNPGNGNSTITEVNMAKTQLFHLGLIDNVGGASNDVATYIALTSATNVQIQTGNPNVQVTGWEVIEYF